MATPRLLAPGPTPLPEEVRAALGRPILHHRTPQYKALLQECLKGLPEVFQTSNEVLILPCTGTGAMEGAVTNLLSAGDTILVAGAGKFAERWASIAKAYGVTAVTTSQVYGQSIDVAEVAGILKARPEIKAVYTQLSETSTGALNDIEALGNVTRNTPTLLVVDAVSGLGGDKLLMDAWGVDVVVTGSQKGLMLPPGLAFASLGSRAWDAVATSKLPKFYFDFTRARKELSTGNDPWTGAVSLMFGLQAALKLIQAETMARIWERHRILAEATRAGVKALGLELFAERPANAVTSIKVPAGVDGNKIPSTMRDVYKVTIAGGQGTMKGNIFRIAHLGHMGRMDLLGGLSALEMTLKDLGYPTRFGAGVGAAEEILRTAHGTEL